MNTALVVKVAVGTVLVALAAKPVASRISRRFRNTSPVVIVPSN